MVTATLRRVDSKCFVLPGNIGDGQRHVCLPCCSSDFRTAQRPVKPSATASVGVEKFGRWPRQFAKKGVKKMTVIRKAALVVAVVVFAAVTATPANNAEQVVFSDTAP